MEAFGRHDTQHYYTQHNDTKHRDISHNDIEHNDILDNDTEHNDIQLITKLNATFSITTLSIMAERYFA